MKLSKQKKKRGRPLAQTQQHKARFYTGDKGRVIADANAPQTGEEFNQDRMRLEFWMAKQIGTDLMKHYPGRQWHIDCDTVNGVVIISCHSVSKRKGYYINLGKHTIAELIVRARKAAGEILERYNVSRSRILDPQTLEGLERDINDEVISSDGNDIARKWNRDR